MLVLIAEYVVVDPEDVRHAPASAGLTAVSFALFLILTIVLRSSEVRLFLLLPALTLAVALVSLRTMNLRMRGQWKYVEAGITALIVSQIAAALHYWPVSPVEYGLAVLAPAYALTSLFSSLSEGAPLRQALVEPGLVLVLLWGIALWV